MAPRTSRNNASSTTKPAAAPADAVIDVNATPVDGDAAAPAAEPTTDAEAPAADDVKPDAQQQQPANDNQDEILTWPDGSKCTVKEWEAREAAANAAFTTLLNQLKSSSTQDDAVNAIRKIIFANGKYDDNKLRDYLTLDGRYAVNLSTCQQIVFSLMALHADELKNKHNDHLDKIKQLAKTYGEHINRTNDSMCGPVFDIGPDGWGAYLSTGTLGFDGCGFGVYTKDETPEGTVVKRSGVDLTFRMDHLMGNGNGMLHAKRSQQAAAAAL